MRFTCGRGLDYARAHPVQWCPGRLDAYIDFGASSAGQAAGAFILQKAGGIVTKYDNFEHYDYRSKGVVACAPGLLEALKKAREWG